MKIQRYSNDESSQMNTSKEAIFLWMNEKMQREETGKNEITIMVSLRKI